MNHEQTAVFAVFPSRAGAERAVDALIGDGFTASDISVLMADREGTTDFAHDKHTKAPEAVAAAAGAVTGGAIGGGLGLLVGLGALAIPGLGPFIAAGPLMAALAGVGAGGAIGGFVGALVGLGIPEDDAKRFEGRVNEGGVLLCAQCETSTEVERAKTVLAQEGGEDISSARKEAGDNVPVPVEVHDPAYRSRM